MDIKTDNLTGDIELENGDLAFTIGVDSTIQFLTARLKLFATEWFLDETKGIPYFDSVFVKNPNPVALDTIFKTAVIESPGVLELLKFSMDIDVASRRLTIAGRIRAFDGEADFTETVVA